MDCKRISLKCVPEDILDMVIKEKTEIMTRTKRVNVSFEEALYKLVRMTKQLGANSPVRQSQKRG